MAGPYSEHRRPTAVPRLQRVERNDVTGEEDLKNQRNISKGQEQLGAKPPPRRPFADLIKPLKKK
ncbi:MAG: hypothetical protein IPJ65_34190 [Archangiaceae bacterium]|nr:hypothetical protein [Archangiaceae bacterium]